ncbi:hypothetical protein BDZ97DRAFT_1609005, partial [Flammula alnicola]
TSHEYMRQWLPLRWQFLDIILEREAPPSNILCTKCKTRNFKIRCADCLGNPVLCVQCCRNSHEDHPFHRIEIWSGTHFSPGWLWKTGVAIHLGHGGNRCPSNQNMDQEVESLMSTFPSTFNDTGAQDMDEDDSDVEEPDGEYGWAGSGQQPHRDLHGAPIVVVVHTNGVHHLPISLCSCPSAPDLITQYLQMGFYPSTYKQIETVFTFQVLDDYRLENLECQTSCHHYYSKLRWMTNSIFPTSVPDRKRELARAERQWRNLKEWKWFGFGHTDAIPGDTDLALFCPTCPQPGVNLPDNWKDDEYQWKYFRSFVVDGNFVAAHQQQLRTTDDIWIKDGEGFMTRRAPYFDHLRCTTEIWEPCTCNEHRAVLDRSKPHKGCDVTEIGAFACLQHGCYCPGSIVDFQVGERQMNVDYGLVQAFNNMRTDQVLKIIVVYDINCQYSKNLCKHVEAGRYLHFRPGLNLVAGIGMFHVHGHQDVCYGRYAPRFIPGAGQSDGEVLERLFSILNGISTIARTMTLAHRTENVDAHMGDNNFKKIIDMGDSNLVQEMENVCSSAIDARSDFELLSQSATPEQTELWTASVQTAECLREEGNVEAMDIYNVKGIKGERDRSHSTDRDSGNLMQAEQEADSGVSVTTWLVAGMKIQEAQLSIPELTLTPTLIIYRAQLVSFIRRQGKKPSGDQRLQINRKCQALRRKADEFQDSFQQLFPAVALDGVDLREIPYGDDVLRDDEDEAYLAAVPCGEVEKMEIFLPSTCPGVLPRQLKTAAKVELKLRIAQAENALEGVRREIGHKSFLFRNNIALA